MTIVEFKVFRADGANLMALGDLGLGAWGGMRGGRFERSEFGAISRTMSYLGQFGATHRYL